MACCSLRPEMSTSLQQALLPKAPSKHPLKMWLVNRTSAAQPLLCCNSAAFPTQSRAVVGPTVSLRTRAGLSKGALRRPCKGAKGSCVAASYRSDDVLPEFELDSDRRAASLRYQGGDVPTTRPVPVPPMGGRQLAARPDEGEDPEHAHGAPSNLFNGVFLLLLLNVAAFVADHILKLPAIKWLYLHHASARWYQFVTSTFCHASWNHLSSNLFFLYIFGRLVEEEEGSVGLWATYLVTGAGANIVSWLILPSNVMSVGASGAVFGLFAVSVLTRLRFNWRKLLEVVILGQFVIERLIVEAQSSAMLAGRGNQLVHTSGVNHVAHLAGALVGVLLIWLVSRLPDPKPS